MKFLITIPASQSQGKKPKLIPAKHYVIEAFTVEQVKRRACNGNAFTAEQILAMDVQPLQSWLDAIPTI